MKMPAVRECSQLCNISQLPYKSSGDWIIDVNHNDQKLEKARLTADVALYYKMGELQAFLTLLGGGLSGLVLIGMIMITLTLIQNGLIFPRLAGLTTMFYLPWGVATIRAKTSWHANLPNPVTWVLQGNSGATSKKQHYYLICVYQCSNCVIGYCISGQVSCCGIVILLW